MSSTPRVRPLYSILCASMRRGPNGRSRIYLEYRTCTRALCLHTVTINPHARVHAPCMHARSVHACTHPHCMHAHGCTYCTPLHACSVGQHTHIAYAAELILMARMRASRHARTYRLRPRDCRCLLLQNQVCCWRRSSSRSPPQQ